MDLILKAVGLLIVALLAFVVIAAWRIMRKLQHALRVLEGNPTQALPNRVHLQRQENFSWSHPGAAKTLLDPLQKRGFVSAGLFEISEMNGIRIQGLVHPGHSIYAVVYEHPIAGMWVELSSRYIPGERLKSARYSNVNHQSVNQSSHPPFRRSVKIPGLDVDSLFLRFLNERPAYDLEPVAPEKFVEVYERSHAEEMDWRNAETPRAEAVPPSAKVQVPASNA